MGRASVRCEKLVRLKGIQREGIFIFCFGGYWGRCRFCMILFPLSATAKESLWEVYELRDRVLRFNVLDGAIQQRSSVIPRVLPVEPQVVPRQAEPPIVPAVPQVVPPPSGATNGPTVKLRHLLFEVEGASKADRQQVCIPLDSPTSFRWLADLVEFLMCFVVYVCIWWLFHYIILYIYIFFFYISWVLYDGLFFGIVGDGWSRLENLELTAKPSFWFAARFFTSSNAVCNGQNNKKHVCILKDFAFCFLMLPLLSCRFELFHFFVQALLRKNLGKRSLPDQSCVEG